MYGCSAFGVAQFSASCGAAAVLGGGTASDDAGADGSMTDSGAKGTMTDAGES